MPEELIATEVIEPLGFDQLAWQKFLTSQNQPSYRATQIIKAIHQHQQTDFSLISNIPKTLAQHLQLHCSWRLPKIILDTTAADGTRKWLMQLYDGPAIETVFIPEDDRGTLCISSQVGCSLNCQFCATAVSGFSRNLSASEIIAQLWLAKKMLIADEGDYSHPKRKHIISNVVMMGMGEPMLNLDALLPSLSLMLDDDAYGLSQYRVTVSTSGVVPGMAVLRDQSPCSLAVSLHAANDTLRSQIVPLNKKYPLSVLIKACQEYFHGAAFKADNKRKIVFEYVMLAGVNDQKIHAQQLIKLLANIPNKMNLIPFNPFPGSHFQASPFADILKFQKYLRDAGMLCFIRKTRGQKIDAACGQLQGNFSSRLQSKRVHFYSATDSNGANTV